MKQSPPADGVSLGPTLEVLSTVWRLNHALEATSKRMSATLGISAPHRMLLRIVEQFPGISPGRLSRLLQVDPGTVSAALRRLEGEGLLERREDTRDHRRSLLRLTATGKRTLASSEGTVEGALGRALDRVDEQTRTAMLAGLTAFSEELERGLVP